MANSKRKQILNYLRDTTLAGIAQVKGYNCTVRTVERGLRPIDSIADSNFPALFISKTIEKRQNITKNQFQSLITVFIVGFVKNPTGRVKSQEALDDLIEDVTKAMETDRLKGNLAKWTEVKSVETDEGDLDQHAAFVMECEVSYVTEGVTP